MAKGEGREERVSVVNKVPNSRHRLNYKLNSRSGCSPKSDLLDCKTVYSKNTPER